MSNYIGDFVEDFSTLSFKFLTSSLSTSSAMVPVTLAGTPVLSVYKNGSIAESVAGITLTVDFDGITGLNHVAIDLSADAFYEIGADYEVVITTGTIAGDSTVGRIVASFSIENRSGERTLSVVTNLTVGSASPSVSPESAVLTTGTEVNTYLSATNLDGGYHEVSDVAGAIDFYYQFDIGNNRLAASVAMNGRLEGKDDVVGVHAWNWITLTWNQIGSMTGSSTGAPDGVVVFTVLSDHTGAGTNEGKVRIRGLASGLTGATMFLDRAVVRHVTDPVSQQTLGAITDTGATSQIFDTDLTQSTGIWDDALITFTSGILEGESKIIRDYTSGTITLDEPLIAAPGNTDTFVIRHTHTHTITQIGQAVRAEIDTNSTALIALLSNLSIVDTIVDAIKAKTDKLTFTKALELDANIQSINNATVVGDGQTTPWEGAP